LSKIKKLKPYKDKAGYNIIYPRKNGKTYRYKIGRLVLLTFKGKCPNNMELCHNNGIPDDDRFLNIRWDTHINNCVDRKKHGTEVYPILHGEDAPNAKLNEQQVRVIKSFKQLKNRPMYKEIGKFFGVTLACIQDIIYGRSWKHLKE